MFRSATTWFTRDAQPSCCGSPTRVALPWRSTRQRRDPRRRCPGGDHRSARVERTGGPAHGGPFERRPGVTLRADSHGTVAHPFQSGNPARHAVAPERELATPEAPALVHRTAGDVAAADCHVRVRRDARQQPAGVGGIVRKVRPRTPRPGRASDYYGPALDNGTYDGTIARNKDASEASAHAE